jgi:hypothetical protein
MPQTFVFDSRLPVSENASESDPNHPKNVMRSAAVVQNQASADTKYDIYPPPRVEGFATASNETLLTILSIIGIIVSLTFLLRAANFAVKMVLVVVLVVSIHYAIGRLENRTV